MTTAQVYTNGVQMGAPSPPTLYNDLDGVTQQEVVYSTLLSAGAAEPLVAIITIEVTGRLKTLCIPNITFQAAISQTSWSFQDPIPLALRPDVGEGASQSAMFYVLTMINGAPAAAILNISTVTGLMTIVILGATPTAGQQQVLGQTAVTYV